jgi:hypothetical protein
LQTNIQNNPLKSFSHIAKLKGIQFPAALLGVLLIISSFGLPQAGEDIVAKVGNALNTGNAEKLCKYFNNTIDLSLPDSEGTYSDKQAEQLLKVFFKNHPVKSYMLDHQGNSNDGSRYLIGTLISTSAKKFRVYGLIKKRAEKDLIQQLQIEEE